MIDLSLSDLRSFVAVAELSSFGEAASALNISQPALTRRIQKLEELLGVQLLDRTTRQVGPSAVGRDFLPRARHLIDELDSSLLSVREIAERASGLVTVASIPTAVFYLLPEIIEAFGAEFPRVRVKVLDEGANSVLRSVIQGEADLGINIIGAEEAEIEWEPILREPYVLACRRDHPLAQRDKVEWSELAPYKLIMASRLSSNRLLIDQALSPLKCRPRGFYEVNHLTTAFGMVEAGLGVAALPSMSLPRRKDHPVVGRPLTEPVVMRSVAVIRRRGSRLSPAAQSFYNNLMARLSGLEEVKRDESAPA